MNWLHPQFQRDGKRNLESENLDVWTTHDEKAAQQYSALYFALMWTIEQFQDCSPLFWYSNMKVRRCYVKKIVDELQMQEFACVCVHFRSINGTVESAHFFQISNLIKSLQIISLKNPLEIKKNYISPSKSQIFSQLFCVAHS